MRIVVTEFMDADAVATLAAEFDVRYEPDLVDRPRELEQSIASTDALIVRNRTRVTRELIAGAATLRVVGRLGVGLDNIDVASCRERGIEVIAATGANAVAVAEYVIGTAIVLLRGIADCTTQTARGEWPRRVDCRDRLQGAPRRKGDGIRSESDYAWSRRSRGSRRRR